MNSLIFELQIVFYFQLFLSVNVRHSDLKTFMLKPISLDIWFFPAVSLNIYHWRFGPPINHRLFPGNGISGIKREIKQSVVKWIEPNCAFKIINIYLFHPLHLFLLFTFVSHYFIIFLPSTFSGTEGCSKSSKWLQKRINRQNTWFASIFIVYLLSDHSIILRKCIPGWRGCKIARKGGLIFYPT